MSGITGKSGVLPWAEDKIVSAPSSMGIFVLRSLPTLNGIIYVEYSEDLKDSLREKWSDGSVPDVAWFDWYEVESEVDGKRIANEWTEKYAPKYAKA